MNKILVFFTFLCFLVTPLLAQEEDLGEYFDEIHILTAHPQEPCINFRAHETEKVKIFISGQFAADHLSQFRKEYPKSTIVDCREESKIFINGHAITIQKTIYNNTNSNLKKDEILALNDHFVQEANLAKTLTLHHIKKVKVTNKFGEIIKKYALLSGCTEVEVASAMSEPTLVQSMGLNYVFIPITDYTFDVEDFDLIQEIVTTTLEAINKSQDALYFHCKKGVGRSTIAALMALIVIEAKDKTLNALKKQLEEAPQMPTHRSTEHLYSAELNKLHLRKKFFNYFHQYCAQVEDLQAISFKEWVETNQIPKEAYQD